MTIEDIEKYVIRHNLNYPSRKDTNKYKRMFLYAYLYYHHKWTLMAIAKLFNKQGHVTVRNALQQADRLQHYDQFIEATVEIMECTRFIIPEYRGSNKRINKRKKRKEEVITVTVDLTKRAYLKYMKTQDPEIILDILWKRIISKTKRI